MYGILISLGIYISLLVCEKFAKNKNIYWGAAFYSILGGVLGSRIYHVIDYFSYYYQNPIKVFFIWQGGMAIWGGILGGILSLFVYCRFKKVSFVEYADISAVVIPLAQSIGRWGNFFNNELYGQKHHPLFLYESILTFGLFVFLYKKAFKKIGSGYLFGMYLLGYGIIRFFLEFLRIDPWTVHGLNVSQVFCVVSILISLILIKKARV